MQRFLLITIVYLASLPVFAANDPMRPPFFDASQPATKKVPSVTSLKLSMILNAGNRKVAVVNGKSVHVGESVSGYRVTSIHKTRVVLSRKGKVKEIFLGDPKQRNKTKVANRTAATKD